MSANELDRIIDGALSSYSEATPLAGLEERVLNRIRVEEAGRNRSMLWGVALASAMALMVVVVVLRTHPDSARKVADVAVAAKRPVGAIAAPDREVTDARATHPKVKRARTSTVLPKEEQFPAVEPLTDGERALLAFVEQHPAEARIEVARMQERSSEPIEIQPIQIQPLRIDGQQ